MISTFKALVIREFEEKKFSIKIEEREIDSLPKGEVLVEVKYSSLNYKDALSASGNKGVTRNYPHTPGIDAAGIVTKSYDKKFKEGDEVIITGYDLGMNTSGGFGKYIRIPSGWIVKLPNNLSLRESMIYGTAGFTAAPSLERLEHLGIEQNDESRVLITGATGGVGSMAVALAAKAGYKTAALTGKPEKEDFLKELGATEVVGRDSLDTESTKPLLKTKWSGVIDTVGGEILSAAIRSTSYRGSVATCGNVLSPKFDITVFPFILRGVNLLGIDSAKCPMDARLKIWEKLSGDWKLNNLDDIIDEISLNELSNKIDLMLEGKSVGRVVINLDK